MLVAYLKQMKKIKSERIDFMNPLLKLTEFLSLTSKLGSTSRRDYYVIVISMISLLLSAISIKIRFIVFYKTNIGIYANLDLIKEIVISLLHFMCYFGLGFWKREKFSNLLQELTILDFELGSVDQRFQNVRQLKINRMSKIEFMRIEVETNEFKVLEEKTNEAKTYNIGSIQKNIFVTKRNEFKTNNLDENDIETKQSNIIKLKTILSKPFKLEHHQNYFLIELCLILSLISIQFILDVIAWVKVIGFTLYLIFLYENIQTSLMYLVVILMYNLSLSIGYRYEIFTKKLVAFKENKNLYYFQIKYLQRLYMKLDNCVDIFNDVFGWILLLLVLYIVLSLLLTLSSLVFMIDNFETMYIQLMWSLSLMACIVFMASSCEKTKVECEKIKVFCHKTVADFERTTERIQFVEEIKLLGDYASRSTSFFTAAGFFNVDYGLLVPFFESVITYVVVVLQFHKENN